MAESRRLRTQAERDAGYVTYPDSTPGSPSWWLRYGEPEIHHHPPYRPPHLGPAPMDGETCKRWCGFCHLGTGEPEPAPIAIAAAAAGRVLSEHLPAIGEALAEITPRRRWWHRYTRRNP